MWVGEEVTDGIAVGKMLQPVILGANSRIRKMCLVYISGYIRNTQSIIRGRKITGEKTMNISNSCIMSQ